MAKSEGESFQPSRAGDTLEILHAAFEISDPRQRWVNSRTPPVNPAFGVAEAIWMLAGSNDAAVLNYWFPRLPEFAGKGTTYPGAYGYRLRRHFGLDQIRRAYEVLSNNTVSRQVVLQLWDVCTDLSHPDGTPRNSDIPCNVISLLKVRHGRLEWTQVMRSTDLHRGLPYDIIEFTILQEVMAGWLGLGIGGYHHWSDSLHVYSDAAAHFSCEPGFLPERNSDFLAVTADQGEAIIKELYRRTVGLTRSELLEGELQELTSMPEAPAGYQNLLRVLGAESARRRARRDQAEAIMAACTNPQLIQAWSLWWKRIMSLTRGDR